MDAGADCIFTQVCYQPEPIVRFVKDCRKAGIQVPIMVGLMVHDSMRSFEVIQDLSGIRMPEDMREELEEQRLNREGATDAEAVSKFFVNHAIQTVTHILEADVGVWGFQFYTMNSFPPVLAALREFRNMGLL